MAEGFLGIDAGTQGLSIALVDRDLKLIATGDADYAMQPGLDDGCYEQAPGDWEVAVTTAMARLREALSADDREIDALAIGVSGQMHGEVLIDEFGEAVGTSRLWCDTRNQAEADELTERLGCKMPRRLTATRWLWTLRNRSEAAAKARYLTTPAGWLAYRLTGEHVLGIGDASGMFPIDQATLDYNESMLESFDDLAGATHPLQSMLPRVAVAGGEGGALDARGAELLGLPQGVPVAPAEGDQPTAMAGSLISRAGMVSASFGTSVVANSVGDRPFEGISRAVDHFCAVDGKPINMICLINGTTFLNTVVRMLTAVGGDGFTRVMREVLDTPADCDGLLATPFVDDEPAVGVTQGGLAGFVGLNAANAKPGRVAKAALLATMFNLRLGSEVLDAQGYPRDEVVLTGGLARTPELGQLLADVMRAPVTVLPAADEGTAWGAAALAKHRWEHLNGTGEDWDTFLGRHKPAETLRFTPNDDEAVALDAVYQRYQQTPAMRAGQSVG
ncbi:MAG: FGGY family carbohydrate kinase [Planctomycetota bacterium]